MKDKTGKLIRQGDIYWVNFDPSVGSEIKKIRPALVIQDHIIAKKSNTVLVCPIISSNNVHPFDVFISEKFLKSDSRIRTIQVTTCDVMRFEDYLGSLSEDDLKRVLDKILILLGY